MKGREDELQMFGKAARSWQTLNMNPGTDPALPLIQTENTSCKKHVSHTHTYSHTQNTLTGASATQREERGLSTETAMKQHNTKGKE